MATREKMFASLLITITLSEAENESFQVLSQKLISHFESSVTLWQVRQKLEEHRQLFGETVADYYYDILSFCSHLNLPKSEWLYCFVRGLTPDMSPRYFATAN